MSDVVGLHEQIRESEAYQIHIFLGELYTNHYVVVRNIQELHKFLAKCEDPDSFDQLWAYGKQEQLDDAMREVTRLLLNYLTSASARVESTRIMMRRRYGAQPFFKIYQNEVNRLFKGNTLAEFVEGLRNYSAHYAFPIVGGKMEFEQTSGMRQFFMLDRDGLLSSGFDWRKKGGAYLKQSGDEIVIRDFTWSTLYGFIISRRGSSGSFTQCIRRNLIGFMLRVPRLPRECGRCLRASVCRVNVASLYREYCFRGGCLDRRSFFGGAGDRLGVGKCKSARRFLKPASAFWGGVLRGSRVRKV